MSKANDVQVGGSHYQGKIQHWDFVAAMKLNYFEGNATKYLTRWRKKNGVEDLKKAHHYLTKLVELEETGARLGSTPRAGDPLRSYYLEGFVESHDLSRAEAICLRYICDQKYAWAIPELAALIRDNTPKPEL